MSNPADSKPKPDLTNLVLFYEDLEPEPADGGQGGLESPPLLKRGKILKTKKPAAKK